MAMHSMFGFVGEVDEGGSLSSAQRQLDFGGKKEETPAAGRCVLRHAGDSKTRDFMGNYK